MAKICPCLKTRLKGCHVRVVQEGPSFLGGPKKCPKIRGGGRPGGRGTMSKPQVSFCLNLAKVREYLNNPSFGSDQPRAFCATSGQSWSGWSLSHNVSNTVDGRNPAPPKQP